MFSPARTFPSAPTHSQCNVWETGLKRPPVRAADLSGFAAAQAITPQRRDPPPRRAPAGDAAETSTSPCTSATPKYVDSRASCSRCAARAGAAHADPGRCCWNRAANCVQRNPSDASCRGCTSFCGTPCGQSATWTARAFAAPVLTGVGSRRSNPERRIPCASTLCDHDAQSAPVICHLGAGPPRRMEHSASRCVRGSRAERQSARFSRHRRR